jgi:hypothetical protein
MGHHIPNKKIDQLFFILQKKCTFAQNQTKCASITLINHFKNI